ncbi:hypothetical protein KHA80_05950 [Anaerobacillus sp. HL2]|nr:hypothetical protein KHA80_05950 [Anaerobacillus sp. HL2]
MKYGEKGYSYIINGKGTIIAHPKREMVTEQFNPIEGVKEDSELQSIANLFETIFAEKQGIGEYLFNGNNLYAGFAPLKGQTGL